MATLVYITVTGTYLMPDGVTPKVGYIEFRPTVPLSVSGTGIIISEPLQAQLDLNGHFEVELLATDNADIAPTGWLWFVDEKVKNGNIWYMQCKSVANGGFDPLNISYVFYPPGAAVSPPTVIQPSPNVGVTVHNQLTGLAANDHPQYSLTSHTHTPASIGAEPAGAVAAHVADVDPHPQYATDAYVDSTRTGRNRIINGDFSVNQRASASVTANLAFGFDRWFLNRSGGTVTYSVQTAALGTLPESARSYARLDTVGQAAAGDCTYLSQRIESVRTLSGKTVTTSFWAKAASGTPKIAVEMLQHFGTGGSPSTPVFTYVNSVTLSTVWTRYSVTGVIPSIAGKVIGTAVDDRLQFNLWTSAGSTFNSSTGSLGIQNNTIDIWGVQVEEGPAATIYEQKTYSDELRACLRYFYRLGLGSPTPMITGGQVASGTQVYVHASFIVPMRVIPNNVAASAGWSAYDSTTIVTISSIANNGSDQYVMSLLATTSAGLATGRAIYLYGNAGSYVDFSAEL